MLAEQIVDDGIESSLIGDRGGLPQGERKVKESQEGDANDRSVW